MMSRSPRTYKGQPIDTLTKDVLLEALNRAMQHIEDLRRFAEEDRAIEAVFTDTAQRLACPHVLSPK